MSSSSISSGCYKKRLSGTDRMVRLYRLPDTTHRSLQGLAMLDTAEHVIALLLPVIVENIDSLRSLNMLTRTNKSLRLTAVDVRLVQSVVANMPAATRAVLRKLFVLSVKVALPCMMLPCPYAVFRLVPRCSVVEGFRRAMVVHTSIGGIAKAFHVRQRRSVAMKLVWKTRKEEMQRLWRARRCDVEQILNDLFMIPSFSHVTTNAEVSYMGYGIVSRLGNVYRDKRKLPFVPVPAAAAACCLLSAACCLLHRVTRTATHHTRSHGAAQRRFVDGQHISSSSAHRHEAPAPAYKERAAPRVTAQYCLGTLPVQLHEFHQRCCIGRTFCGRCRACPYSLSVTDEVALGDDGTGPSYG
jgi:hypothetical protein